MLILHWELAACGAEMSSRAHLKPIQWGLASSRVQVDTAGLRSFNAVDQDAGIHFISAPFR